MTEQIDHLLMQLWIYVLKLLCSADDEPAAKADTAMQQLSSKMTAR